MREQFDAVKFRECAKEALAVSSEFIRRAIIGDVDLTAYLVKGDKTAVTFVDKQSQELARPIIQRDFGQYRLNAEETPGETGNRDSDMVILHDPLDGTGGFLIGGPTPTVILGAYDSKNKRVLACATMEPTTGRFWFSSLGNGAYLSTYDYTKQSFDSNDGRKIHVNNAPLEGAHVLVDVSHPFSRLNGTRQVLTQSNRRDLTSRIENLGAKEASFYTNGGHYALVATGRPTIAGNITTAIGGPFDVAGICHVIEAGGVAICYRIDNDASPRRLYPLKSSGDIYNADIVMSANSVANLLKLQSVVSDSLTPKFF